MHVEQDIDLKGYTTFAVGGSAEYFVTVSTEAALEAAIAYAHEKNLHVTLLGGGSNVLVSDEGVRGLVVRMNLRGITESHENEYVYLTALAGETLDDVVAYAVAKGYWGIENLSHIPGSVGATPVQNVGAYGVEVADCITSVRVLNSVTGVYSDITNEECAFGYRDSFFKSEAGKQLYITAVTFKLEKNGIPKIGYKDLQNYFAQKSTPTLQEIRDAVIAIRANKFPNWHEVGTAGSFFKNPIITHDAYVELQKVFPELPGFVIDDTQVKLSLGWILDSVFHLKGYTVGSVAAYEKQALVLVAYQGATATDVEQFANSIIANIQSKMNIVVEWEVTKIK